MSGIKAGVLEPVCYNFLMLIDSHCHLHDREFFATEQAEEMVGRAHAAGVEKIVCIGTSHEDSLAARDFANTHKDVFWTYGIHPENAGRGLSEPVFSDVGLEKSGTSYAGWQGEPPATQANLSVSSGIYVPDLSNQDLIHQKEQVSSTRLVAIGEVGLDYHYEGYDREAQIRLFEQMLQLATDNDLPVSFHVREAYDDFFPILANFPKIRGVVHSFTDSKRVLKRILNETEFFIGVNGLATYSTLPTPPLVRILLETDAPFLTPVPFRGIINEPAYVRQIADWLATKLGQEYQTIEMETTKNATKLFKL